MDESDPLASSMGVMSFGVKKNTTQPFAQGRAGPQFCAGSLVCWECEHPWLKAPLRLDFRQAQLKIHPSGMGRHLWNCPGLWSEV